MSYSNSLLNCLLHLCVSDILQNPWLILKLHKLRVKWRLRKPWSDPFQNTWLKSLLFHTHVSSKRGHIVAFRAIISSRFACQRYYNRWRLVRLQLIFYLFSFSQYWNFHTEIKMLIYLWNSMVLHWVSYLTLCFFFLNM